MNTPMQKLSDYRFMKMENFNPGGSHKTRAARHMVKDAMDAGYLVPGGDVRIIEKTGGNLGIGLAIEASKQNIAVDLAVGLSFSPHKKKLMSYFGANLIGNEMLQKGAQPRQVIEHHLDNAEKDGQQYYFIDQFNNDSNFRAHYKETGPEIFKYILENNLLNKKIIFAAGIGSGASLSGIGSYLKERINNIEIVGINPEGCDFESETFVSHDLQGLAVGVKPKIFRSEIVDRYIYVNEKQALDARKKFALETGQFFGNSSAANLLGTQILEEEVKGSDTCIISLIYDSGDSYLN